MADKRISELVTIATVDLAMDLFPIVDSSAAETKKITPIALKTSLSLNNVDNTSDLNKPISTLTQGALDNKQATLISGSNIKTINSTTILGGGDLQVAPASGIDATAIATGVVSNAEFETLNGVTSAIQVQLDAKQATITGGATTIASTDLTVSRALVSNAVGKVAVATTTSTELGYVNGVTSAIQTQLDAKQATLVSGTNIKTINSTSILGSGNIAISASPSGVAGAIQFSDGSAFASDAANLFWDDTNNRLGVGTNAPSATGHFKGSGSTSATTSLLVQNSAGTDAVTVLDNLNATLGGTVTSVGGFRSIAYFDSFQRVALNNGLNTNPQNYIISGGIGRILLVDNSEGDFNRLQFGGTSASFPSLKRSSTTIQARLADDSGYAPIDASLYKVGGTNGFTGTGSYTNFTIVGGIITNAS